MMDLKPSPSYVIIDVATGSYRRETFSRKTALEFLATGNFHVIPIREYLASLNEREVD